MKISISTSITKILFVLTIASFIASCSKDKDVVTPVTACFEDTFNGTYLGSDSNFVDEVTVKLTKTSCTTATLESVSLGNRNVKEISASSPGAYVGKLDNGTAVSISLSGNNLSLSASGYANFSGVRQ